MGFFPAAAAVLIMALGTPAAPATQQLTVKLNPVTIAPGQEYVSTSLTGTLKVKSTAKHRVDFRIDLGTAADLVELAFEGFPGIIIAASEDEDPCRESGPVRDCSLTTRPAGGFLVPMGVFSVKTKPGVKAGDSGTIAVTSQLDGGPKTASTSRVRIGEGVNLTNIGTHSATPAPGRTATIMPRVRNTGRTTAHGAALYFQLSRQLIQTNAGNCFYGSMVTCVFDTDLVPGATYQLSRPVTLYAPVDSAQGSTTFATYLGWMTPAEWEDQRDVYQALAGRSGSGPKITLVPVSAAVGAPQTDPDYKDNAGGIGFAVVGRRRLDVAVMLSRPAPLRPGTSTKVTLGVINRGSATLYPSIFENNYLTVGLQAPVGITLTSADRRCQNDFSTARVLFCSMPYEGSIRPGGRASFPVTATATKAFTGGRMQARVDPALASLQLVAARGNDVITYGMGKMGRGVDPRL
jgi:hypothetical protein